MAESTIQLRKLRDFGENFNDTFSFIRQNVKALLRAFFGICGIFLLLHAIAMGVYQSRSFGLFRQLRWVDPIPGQPGDDFIGLFSIEYFLVLLLGALSYCAVIVMVASYLKFYDAHPGEAPRIDQVWTIFKNYFFRVFIYSIPVGALVITSIFFCCLPFFYFAVVLAPFQFAVVMEDLNFREAFNRCFEIIRNNFWTSLAIYLVAALIYYVSSLIISGVIGLVVGLASYLTTKDIGSTVGILASVLNMFSSLFSLVLFISVALNYFHLVEKTDGTGILKRIEQMGNEDTLRARDTDEQY